MRVGNQKSMIVMPTLRRPEMLALSLERIAQADNRPDDIRIFVDHTTNEVLDEMDYVRDRYYPTAQIFHAGEHTYAPSGCYNILHALKDGYETGAEFVFMIEEDCMVFPDFFKWAYQAQNDNPDCFATCGRLRPEYRNDFYTNPGACFRHDALGFVTPHITNEFFNDRRGYMDATFGEFPEESDLDDGLIRRVIRQQDSRVVYPDTPKVAHQGFHFYNKLAQYKVEGSIAERIAGFRDLSAQVSPSERYARDFEPFRPQQ